MVCIDSNQKILGTELANKAKIWLIFLKKAVLLKKKAKTGRKFQDFYPTSNPSPITEGQRDNEAFKRTAKH